MQHWGVATGWLPVNIPPIRARRTISGSRPALIESGWKNASGVVQGSGAVQEGRHLKLKLVRRIKAGHMLLATAARLAKAREKRKNSCRFGVHSETLGYVYFLH